MTVNVPPNPTILATMARPAFSLTDDQARIIAARVDALQAAYPVDRRNHRPFVRGFILAVGEATGALYSPAIYLRLLAAFAPERKPSTATLASEKQRLAVAVASRPVPQPDTAVTHALGMRDFGQLHALVRDAVDAGIAGSARSAGLGAAAQTAFYADRLRDAEQELAAMRAQCARLAVTLAQAQQSATQHEQEAARASAASMRHAESIASLTGELADMRKFALQSIDEARGETRVWKERSVALEAQRQVDARLMETFRQLAYQRGSAIPDALRQENAT